jgi:hypothetical protein
LVSTAYSPTTVAALQALPDSAWNSASVTTAAAPTSISAAGLDGGSYRIYTADSAGNLSAPSADLVTVLDTVAPFAATSGASISDTQSVPVQSSEVGTAYLVSTNFAPGSVAEIQGLPDADWNAVPITTPGADTLLSAGGLNSGTYRLYTADTAGNLSAPEPDLISIDANPPTVTLEPDVLNEFDFARVKSTEIGDGYLVRSGLAVGSVADILALPDAQWNFVDLPVANTFSDMPLTGLLEGIYQAYASDLLGNLSGLSIDAVRVDNTAPTAAATPARIKSSASATVQSSELGSVYLVKNNNSPNTLAELLALPNNEWNIVDVTAANTDTALAATGLVEGSYRAYAVDAANNLSAASAETVIVDDTRPAVTLQAATINANGSAQVRSTEVGTGYLVNSTRTPSSVADIQALLDNEWNSVALPTADLNTSLNATGLIAGTYKAYAADGAGNLSAVSAGTVTVDNTAPVLDRAEIDPAAGTNLRVYFFEALNITNGPNLSQFSATNTGTGIAVPVNNWSVFGNFVHLYLGLDVTGQTIRVNYTDLTAGDDLTAIQDAAGNDVLSFSILAV